jgi:UDP-GlcNAc:undecaprenyl-phosphate/decaprenyl-phosphate GlcNAc-1-phosphate transferase
VSPSIIESPSNLFSLVIALAAGAALSLALTPLARIFARRIGLVAPPRDDRWHRRPMALLGGPPIVIAALVGLLGGIQRIPSHFFILWICGGLTIVTVGLLDDIVGLRASTKLIGQIVAATIPIYGGLGIPPFPRLLSFAVTLLWIVGITNAFNLLDNMDGLAAGVAAIAAVFLCIHAAGAGRMNVAIASTALAGAATGFLVYNFQPASIFMGDAGSLFLGYSLAVLSLMDLRGRPLVSLSIIAVPAFVLLIPIFDTSLVTVLRVVNGRRISEGGRDHSSHRLVSLGLTERRAVLTLYILSASAGGISLLLPRFHASLVVIVVLAVTLIVYYFGAYLGSVGVYRDDARSIERAKSRGFFVLDTFIAHKALIVDVMADLAIICISYIAAFLLRFEGVLSPANEKLLIESLPILVAVRLLAFFALRLYRNVPGSFSMHDFITIFKAVLVSSTIFVTVLVLLYRFKGYSRAVMIIDGVLVLSGTTFARLAIRSLQEVFGGVGATSRRRVLILGAGSLGEAVARLIKSDPQRTYQLVGFLDDNPTKVGRKLNGCPVLGPTSCLEELISELGVQEIILAASRLDATRKQSVLDLCRRFEIDVREAGLVSV